MYSTKPIHLALLFLLLTVLSSFGPTKVVGLSGKGSNLAIVRAEKAVITFEAIPSKKVGDAAFLLKATSTNTRRDISFRSSNDSVITLKETNEGWRVTIIGAGKVVITASQPGGFGFAAASAVNQTLTVEGVEQIESVLTFAALSAKQVGDPAFVLQATSTNIITPITFSSSNANVVTVSNATGRWMATVVGVGSTNIIASQVAGYGFAVAANVSQTISVKAAPLVASVISLPVLPAKKVGDSAFLLQASSTNPTSPITFVSSNPAVATVALTTEGWKATVVAAGTVTITASQMASSGFTAAASVSQSLVVAAVPSAIYFASLLARKMGDAPFVIQASSTNSVTPITFASSNPAVATVSFTPEGWKVAIVGAGAATITASQVAGNGFAAAASVRQPFTVAAADPVAPVLAFAALSSKQVGDPAFLLQATSSNTGTPITFSSSNPAVVKVSNITGTWMATVLAAGTTTITASQAAGNGFLAAASVSRTLTVAAIPSVLAFSALPSKKVGDASFGIQATSTNLVTPVTFSSSNLAVATVSNTTEGWKVTIKGIGTAHITASQVAGNGFAAASSVSQPFTVAAADPVASVLAFAALPSKQVGDQAFLLQASSTNTVTPIAFASSNPAVVQVSNASGRWMGTVVGAGSATITASQVAGNGFTAAASVSQPISVKAAPLVAAIISFADLPSKKMDDQAFLLQASSTNAGTPFTFTSSNTAVATTTLTAEGWKVTLVGAGSTVITASQAAGNGFLAAANVSRSFTVAPVPAVIAFAPLASKMVGDAAFSLKAASSNTLTPITFTSSNAAVVSVANTPTGWVATVVGEGTANITASQVAGNGYAAAASVSQLLTVAPAALVPAVITFAPIPSKKVSDPAFLLQAKSTNTTTPVTFKSSNAAVATVGTTAEGWKVTLVGAGTAVITASQAAGNGFAAAVSANQTLTVAAADPIAAVISCGTLASKTMADPAFQLEATSTNTITPIIFSSSNAGIVAVSNATGKWMATVVAPGTADITVSQAAGNGYTAAASVNRPVKVEAIPAVITFAELPSKKVGDPDFLLQASSTNTHTPITFASSNPMAVKVSNATGQWMATVVAAGTANITASQEASNKFLAAANVVRTQMVAAVPAVIAFAPLASKTVGDAAFPLQASSSNSVTPITFTSSNPAVVSVANTISGWKATVVGAGTANITAWQAAGNGFAAAVGVIQPLKVVAPTLVPSVITFATLPSKKVGDPAFVLQATSTNSVTPITFASSNTAIVKVSNATGLWVATVVGAGTANITALQGAGNGFAAAANVSRSLVVANQTVAPNPVAFVEGTIPFRPYWGYHKDKSTQDIAALFNGVINENVNMGWTELLPESDIVLNFPDQMEVELQKISFFDGAGALSETTKLQTIFVERGTGREIQGPDYLGSKYNVWLDHALSAPIKISSIILRKKKGIKMPDEIRLYGKYKPYVPAPYIKPAYELKRMLGINTYPYNNQSGNAEDLKKKVKAISPYHVVRDYVDWGLLEIEDGEYSFNPTIHGGWKLDEIYARHKANGKEVLVCLKDIPDWMKATYPAAIQDHENAPFPYKSTYTTVSGTSVDYFNAQYTVDKRNPASYVKVAKVAFQFAARYGKNSSVDPALMKVTSRTRWAGGPSNVVKIGMDLISKIEANNEMDRHWKGRQANQTSDEYAAYLSAFYDGHMGSLGPGVGVKQADPNMVVVVGGIASTSPAYYQGLVDWCKKNRGYLPNGKVNLCFDEINYHAYNNNKGGEQYASGERVGVSPELSKAPEGLTNFHQVNKEILGELPIIITETGYDWNSKTQGAKVIGSKDVFFVQGEWTLRSSLEYAMAGLSGLYFYQLYDDGSGSITNTTQYMTSGHADRATLERRPVGDFMAQVGNQFGDFLPVDRLSKDPRVDRYRNNTGLNMYACWIPDEIDRRQEYTLTLGTDSAMVYTLQVRQDSLQMRKVKTNNGSLTFTITETPTFIVGAGAAVSAGFSTYGMERNMKEEELAAAGDTKLKIYPNPLTQNATIEVMAEETGEAVVDIYDGQGKRVRHLQVGMVEKGVPSAISLNADNLPNGVYVARLSTGQKVVSQKILIMN